MLGEMPAEDVMIQSTDSQSRYRAIVFQPAATRTASWTAPPLAVARPPKPQTRPAEEVVEFVSLVLSHCGTSQTHYRIEPQLRRIAACLRAIGADSVRDGLRIVKQDPARRSLAASALLIGVTSFFRDPPLWQFLRTKVMPDLFERRSRLDAWSVACSDGAELYSLAMLIREQRPDCQGSLIGTDCQPASVRKALAGRYTLEVAADIPQPLHSRYMTPAGPNHYQVCDDLRAMTMWRIEDAFDARTGQTFDIVLCRNLAIYLQPEASATLWKRLYAAIRPGGLLITGKAEKPDSLRMRRVGPCCFQTQELS